tara:strand:- start:6897 stop:7079 length:183 start_codon:yes stop_codon:yes gene_type:complete
MSKDLSKAAAVNLLKRIAETGEGDIEAAHVEADAILCALLIELDCGEVVEAWQSVPRWYA